MYGSTDQPFASLSNYKIFAFLSENFPAFVCVTVHLTSYISTIYNTITNINICLLLGKQDETLKLVKKLLEGQEGLEKRIKRLEDLEDENKKLKETVEKQQKEISASRRNAATKKVLREHVEKFNELGTRCAEYENLIKNQG